MLVLDSQIPILLKTLNSTEMVSVTINRDNMTDHGGLPLLMWLMSRSFSCDFLLREIHTHKACTSIQCK